MVRWLYMGAGLLAVALGLLGVVLPLLPTTPFLLLAAGCFARSSPRLQRWLYRHPLFGTLIRNWEERRCVNCAVKRLAVVCVLVFGGYAVFVALQNEWAKVFGGGLVMVSLITLWRLDVCDE